MILLRLVFKRSAPFHSLKWKWTSLIGMDLVKKVSSVKEVNISSFMYMEMFNSNTELS